VRVEHETVGDFADFGVHAFTTTRAAGSFNTAVSAPVAAVLGRWDALAASVMTHAPRFATARQVHGRRIVVHDGAWQGWLRCGEADGHIAPARGTGLGVTVADCVPIFLAHPSGATALLHSGWRGTAAGILDAGVAELARLGFPASELRVHLGPAICGTCYEVSPDVYAELTGTTVSRPTPVDLRALLADRARTLGMRHITTSPFCTRCDNDRFFSHRAGDDGRQVAVIVAGCGMREAAGA
jgi:YfiH family protein